MRQETKPQEKKRRWPTEIRRRTKEAEENWITDWCYEVYSGIRTETSKAAFDTLKLLIWQQQAKTKLIENTKGRRLTEEKVIQKSWTEYWSRFSDIWQSKPWRRCPPYFSILAWMLSTPGDLPFFGIHIVYWCFACISFLYHLHPSNISIPFLFVVGQLLAVFLPKTYHSRWSPIFRKKATHDSVRTKNDQPD